MPDIHWLARRQRLGDDPPQPRRRHGHRAASTPRPAPPRCSPTPRCSWTPPGTASRSKASRSPPTRSKALIYHNSVRVWRLNTKGIYHVFDFATKKLTPLSAKPGYQMFAKFSPDAKSRRLRARQQPLRRPARHRRRARAHDRRLRPSSSTARATGSTRRSSASATDSAGAPTASASRSTASTSARCRSTRYSTSTRCTRRRS